MEIPRISVQEMRRIDELAVSHFGVEVIQMMETAGRAVLIQEYTAALDAL